MDKIQDESTDSLQKTEMETKLGVVIIGRNEGKRLEKTLRELIKTDIPLVYVDSRSKDNSVEIAKKLAVNVLVLPENKRINASRARNEGAKALIKRYPLLQYFQFLDADTVLAENWLHDAFSYMENHPGVGFMCGQLREKDRNKNIYRRLCDMEWRWNATKNAEPCQLGGMGIMRKEAYIAVGGYDESLIAGADPELYMRIKLAGWDLHVIEILMGIHDSGMHSFRQWWIRSVKTGFGFAHGKLTGSWSRERKSALLWAGIFPLMIIIAQITLTKWFFLGFLIYPLNVIRIWMKPVKNEFNNSDRWLYAVACIVTKFPQLVGMIKYKWNEYTGKSAAVIQYK